MDSTLRTLRKNRKATLGAAILLGFLLLATLGPLLVREDPDAIGVPNQAPSLAHLFGTTGQGQDVLAQTILGARVSLAVGFTTGALVMVLGALVGLTAGYFGGWIDAG